MITPKELQALTTMGKANADSREKIRSQKEEKEERERRLELALKEQAEASNLIQRAEISMKVVAESGENAVLLFQVSETVVENLTGVHRIVAKYFIQNGFEVSTRRIDSYPDYSYYLKVSW